MKNNFCKNIGALFRKILPQIVILSLIGVLYLLSLFEIIPSPIELNGILVEKFKTYGLPLIAICAFLENFVLVNAYFPGAFTILTGMALTAGNPSKAVLTYFVIYLPSYTANILSYYCGFLYKGEDIGGATQKKRGSLLWFFLTYWHPQLAALTAFSTGAKKSLSHGDFIKHSLSISLFWSMFWGIIIYHFGFFTDIAHNFVVLFLGYVMIWAAVDIYRWFRNQLVAVKP